MDFIIRILTKSFLEPRLPEFIEILRSVSSEYWREEHFTSDLPAKFSLSTVAMKEGKVAGFIIASLKNNGPYIHKFMVRSDLRGKNIGTEMLKHFELNLNRKGFNSVELSAREDNPEAIRFYEKHRFTVNGKRKDSKDGAVLVIMRKELS